MPGVLSPVAGALQGGLRDAIGLREALLEDAPPQLQRARALAVGVVLALQQVLLLLVLLE